MFLKLGLNFDNCLPLMAVEILKGAAIPLFVQPTQ